MIINKIKHKPKSFQKKQDFVSVTFDDGPDKKYTPKILDILKTFEVKASFFLVGRRAEKNPDLVKRIFEEGHDVGNHTYSHPISPIFNYRMMERQIEATNRIIGQITRQRPTLFRPTWASWNINCRKMLNMANGLGCFSVGWSISSIDWLGRRRIIKYKTLNKDINCGDIFLFHDGAEKAIFPNREATVMMLPEILHSLRKKNFSVLKLSELLPL